MLVFSGSSNRLLAGRLAKSLKTRVGEMELSRFANDEVRVWVKEKQVGKRAVLLQSLSQPVDTHLVEFALISDALKRKGVKEIIAVIPWLGYTKQDKVFRAGEPLSAEVVAKMLQVVPLKRVIVYDLHNLTVRKFFDVPVKNLSGRKLFREYFANKIDKETILVAVDAGAAESSARFGKDLGIEVAYINKRRDLNNGRVTIKGISKNVKGKKVLIKDDMIATGSTLVEAAKFLKKQAVQSVEVAATHHLYVPGAQKKIDQSPIDSLLVTDTVEPREKSRKLRVISVADKLAEEIGD